MRSETLAKLIARDRGSDESNVYSNFILESPQIVIDTARELLKHTPHSFGACAMLSAAWAALLRDRYEIPAVAVAGNLVIRGRKIFECTQNVPESTDSQSGDIEEWNGHCWLEVHGYLGDASIFRTAYAIQRPSVLKEFIIDNFGAGRGVLLSPEHELTSLGMLYEPKYVLCESRVNGLIAGLRHLVANRT